MVSAVDKAQRMESVAPENSGRTFLGRGGDREESEKIRNSKHFGDVWQAPWPRVSVSHVSVSHVSVSHVSASHV